MQLAGLTSVESKPDAPRRSQMSSAPGVVKSTPSGTKFTAVFVIDEVTYIFAGPISPSLQAFSCANATLKYTNPGDLAGTHTFEGRVGIKGLKFTLDNGPVIEGQLDEKVDPASTVDGAGTWVIAP